jgi:hypothetical protein
MRMRWVVPALALAACGGGDEGAAVEGTFAPGLSASGVWVVESERSEPADSAGFRVADLTPGPATLRLMRGSDTAGILNLSGLGPGTRVRLRELRVDSRSGFAFPRSVEVDGAPVVIVNGLRMAPEGRVPREVDVRASVLGWSPDAGALLVRPDDARLPDLRVVVGMATEVVGTDGGGADATTLQPGDSVSVLGRSEAGYVIATRLTLPTRIGEAEQTGGGGDNAASGEEGGGGEDEGGSVGAVSRIPRGGSATPPPPRNVVDRGRGAERGGGRGRGEAKGKGKGKGKG